MTQEELAELRRIAKAADEEWDHLVVLKADQVHRLLDHIAVLREIALAVADATWSIYPSGEHLFGFDDALGLKSKARALLEKDQQP